MDASFWHDKWKNGEIPFHQQEVNPMLKHYIGHLNLAQASRIFVPLCGKTKDIGWLLAHGYQVTGVELSELAIRELFVGLGLTAIVATTGHLIRYQAENLEIFVGDIFDLYTDVLGEVGAIYDRAALVALPTQMRSQYSSHLVKITQSAPQLLITYEYNQQLMNGPPFSVSEKEVAEHYQKAYHLHPVGRRPIPGGLKGKVEALETVWILN